MEYLKESLDCNWAVATYAVVLSIGAVHVSKFCYNKFGSWVAVTGATDGIGKAYCIEFAKRGLNVCLLSRTESRLAELAEELRGTYEIETKHMAVDFSNASEDQWQKIRNLLSELELGILVNNVGCSYDYPEYLHLIDDATIHRLIAINIHTTVQMTRAALPGMLERRRGMIMNIGSGAGSLLPSSPLLSVYSGTKAFVEQFTLSCNVEYKEKGILFQNQAPLFVATKMSKIRRASLTAPSPDAWVKGALQQAGNGAMTSGYWIHNIMWACVSAVPKFLMDPYTLSLNKTIRSKALKKRAQAAKKE